MAGDGDFRPWNELIPDALGLIFSKLNGQEVLQVIPLVCKSWCKVVEGPYCWQRIDTRHFFHDTVPHEEVLVKVEQVLQALIPRSSGSLRELYVSCIDDHMLSFITEHVGSLETLDIGFSLVNKSTFEQFATELGSLTTLVIRSKHGMSHLALEAISKNCKRLVSLSWDDCFARSMPNVKRLSFRYSQLEFLYFFSLLSGSPELKWVKIRGHNFDLGLVKKKYPNLVTLGSDTGGYFIDRWGDFSYPCEDY